MNKPNKNNLLDTEDELMVARWEGAEILGEKVKGLESTTGSYKTVPRMCSRAEGILSVIL